MAVQFPILPVGSETSITLKSSGSDQTPYLGGPVQRVARMGDRWSYTVTLRPMQTMQAAAFVSLLLQGLTDKIVCPLRLQGQVLNADTTATSGSGRTLNLTSASGKYVGQYFSLVSAGVRYLHMVTAVSGNAVTVIPPLKVTIAGGEVCEFAKPQIEGWLESSEQSYSVGLVSNVGVSFRINEAR